MDSMTPEQIDIWVAKDRISPIGMAGVVELLATIGASFLSTKEHPLTPAELKKACIVHGVNWSPLEPEETPASAAQVQSLLAMATRKQG
jgi:hypothetical protein